MQSPKHGRRRPARQARSAKSDRTSALVLLGADLIRQLRDDDVHSIFHEPVPDEVVGYRTIVKNPMDLRTCLSELKSGNLTSFAEFREAVLRIWTNAKLFNAPDTIYFKEAVRLQGLSITLLKDVELSLDDTTVQGSAGTSSPPPEPRAHANSDVAERNRTVMQALVKSGEVTHLENTKVVQHNRVTKVSRHRHRHRPPRPPLPKEVVHEKEVINPTEAMNVPALGDGVVQHALPTIELQPMQSSANSQDSSIPQSSPQSNPAAEVNPSHESGLGNPRNSCLAQNAGLDTSSKPKTQNARLGGPPPHAPRTSVSPGQSLNRDRHASYSELYSKYMAASAPMARRLLAVLLDPNVVRANDLPARKPAYIASESHDATSQAKSTVSQFVTSGVDTCSNMRETGDPDLSMSMLTSKNFKEGSIPTSSANLEPKLNSERVDTEFPPKADTKLAMLDNLSNSCSNFGVSSVNGTMFPVEDDNDALPNSSPLVRSAFAVNDVSCQRGGNDVSEPPLKRVRFADSKKEAIPHNFSLKDATNGSIALENELVLSRLDQARRFALHQERRMRPTRDEITNVVNLLVEHKINPAFLQSGDLGLMECSKPEKICSNSFTERSVAIEVAHVDNKYSRIAANNHELIMNLRRLRSITPYVSTSHQPALKDLEVEHYQRLLCGVASIVKSLPPRTVLSQRDIGNAALMFAGTVCAYHSEDSEEVGKNATV